MVASSQRNFDRKLFHAMNNRSLSGESFGDVDRNDGLTTDVRGGTNHLVRARQSYAARISVSRCNKAPRAKHRPLGCVSTAQLIQAMSICREKWSRLAFIFELLPSTDLPNWILKNQLDLQTLSSRREEIQGASRKFGSGMSAVASAPTEVSRALGVANWLFGNAPAQDQFAEEGAGAAN
jgi:hypothetical protein